MKLYYDVHVFFSRQDGYSIPIEIETDQQYLTDDEVIEICRERNLFNEDGDAHHVDYVMECDEYGNPTFQV